MIRCLVLLAILMTFVGCGTDMPISERGNLDNDFNEGSIGNAFAGIAVPAAGPMPFDAHTDARTLAGVVRFLYESKVDPDGYNPISIMCADSKDYEITFPTNLGPHRAEIFIDDFIVVKIDEDWEQGRYNYTGNIWQNNTQRLVYHENGIHIADLPNEGEQDDN